MCMLSRATQAEDPHMAQISHEALEQHKRWRKIPDAMHSAWKAVGAARAKAFPAVSLMHQVTLS